MVIAVGAEDCVECDGTGEHECSCGDTHECHGCNGVPTVETLPPVGVKVEYAVIRLGNFANRLVYDNEYSAYETCSQLNRDERLARLFSLKSAA